MSHLDEIHKDILRENADVTKKRDMVDRHLTLTLHYMGSKVHQKEISVVAQDKDHLFCLKKNCQIKPWKLC